MAVDSFSLASREHFLRGGMVIPEATETDDAPRRPPAKRLSLGGQSTSASNSISSAEEVLGTAVPGSVNAAVNGMLSAVWTRLSERVHPDESFALSDPTTDTNGVDTLSMVHPSGTMSPLLCAPVSYTCIDVDRWLRPATHDPLLVRVTATCLHRLRCAFLFSTIVYMFVNCVLNISQLVAPRDGPRLAAGRATVHPDMHTAAAGVLLAPGGLLSRFDHRRRAPPGAGQRLLAAVSHIGRGLLLDFGRLKVILMHFLCISSTAGTGGRRAHGGQESERPVRRCCEASSVRCCAVRLSTCVFVFAVCMFMNSYRSLV